MARDAVLRLKRGHDRARVHPWIFKGDVADVAGAAAGSAVTVIDSAGRFVGRGFFNPRPGLCCRIVTWRDEPLDDALWAARIADAVRRRDGRGPAARLVWSEADGLPGLVVDRYGPITVIQCLTLGMARRRPALVRALRAVVGEAAVFSADEPAAAALEGFTPAAGWFDSTGPDSVVVDEGPARFVVRLGVGHKTGLYLDQADNRLQVGRLAAGRTVLDAFAYTAGFACQALVAGAQSAMCVESSAEALAGAVDNLALNGRADRADLVAANAFDALRALERAGRRFGLVVLDPPPFARTRTAVDGALRGYKEINLRASRLLEPGGILATFSCSYHVSDTAFETAVRDAATDAGVRLRELGALRQSSDHPALLTVPETRYLKGLLLEAG
ncbi:MAG TPA: class I SAM-dependent rRNA methyltransferase [Methylomirabilota bacterium]|nr:class I SAM-dependent rRNA methyltransferase [Methylomirabilota bacterium]